MTKTLHAPAFGGPKASSPVAAHGRDHAPHPAPRTAPAAPAGPHKRVSREEIIYFANQLAVMVDTGVPLSEALDSIAQQATTPGMKALASGISEQVRGGTPLSEALASHEKIFGNLFIALMRAGEASGQMGAMLQRVAVYLQQERETVKKIKGAMVYPVCMMSFCVLVVVGLLIFVLPRFEKIYAGKGAALPAPTRVLLALSNGLIDYWPVVLGVLIAVVGGLWYYLRTPGGKIALDAFRIKAPLIGRMYRKACLARSLRTMATMVSTGVTMLEGLQISARVAGNHFYSRVWTDLAERVKEGSTLCEQLANSKLVPPAVAQMIGAGEKTGKLGMVMNRVAEFCEDDLNVAVKTITSMIEPVMIISMGLIIGGIAMALLLPVFSISKVMTH